MPTRKIAGYERCKGWIHKLCPDREHNPPSMMVLEPGVYEHTCPSCGKTQMFVIPPRPTL